MTCNSLGVAPRPACALLDRSAQWTGASQAVALIGLWRHRGIDVINCHFVKRNTLTMSLRVTCSASRLCCPWSGGPTC